ncbi:hypothetical protein [Actinomadura sp. 3N407]|uniref:hypothetical protein n=1 Tax=Actinomadura sp. 3N407 TaxID=3457423 RepID=UPI003FCCB5EF
MNAAFQPELVPTWAKLATWAAPLTVLPSAIWRLVTAISAHAGGENPCFPPTASLAEKIYVPSLSFIELGSALMTFGLIRRWGEVFPRWVPFIGARRIPVTAVAAVAIMGAILATLAVWGMTATFVMGTEPLNRVPPGCTRPGWDVAVLYLPSVLWPPLLLAVTWHYIQRRRISKMADVKAP